jgi:isocitrate dehydrogenase
MLREGSAKLSDDTVHELLKRLSTRHRWMHLEKLQEFDGEQGFTRAQGEN